MTGGLNSLEVKNQEKDDGQDAQIIGDEPRPWLLHATHTVNALLASLSKGDDFLMQATCEQVFEAHGWAGSGFSALLTF